MDPGGSHLTLVRVKRKLTDFAEDSIVLEHGPRPASRPRRGSLAARLLSLGVADGRELPSAPPPPPSRSRYVRVASLEAARLRGLTKFELEGLIDLGRKRARDGGEPTEETSSGEGGSGPAQGHAPLRRPRLSYEQVVHRGQTLFEATEGGEDPLRKLGARTLDIVARARDGGHAAEDSGPPTYVYDLFARAPEERGGAGADRGGKSSEGGGAGTDGRADDARPCPAAPPAAAIPSSPARALIAGTRPVSMGTAAPEADTSGRPAAPGFAAAFAEDFAPVIRVRDDDLWLVDERGDESDSEVDSADSNAEDFYERNMEEDEEEDDERWEMASDRSFGAGEPSSSDDDSYGTGGRARLGAPGPGGDRARRPFGYSTTSREAEAFDALGAVRAFKRRAARVDPGASFDDDGRSDDSGRARRTSASGSDGAGADSSEDDPSAGWFHGGMRLR